MLVWRSGGVLVHGRLARLLHFEEMPVVMGNREIEDEMDFDNEEEEADRWACSAVSITGLGGIRFGILLSR